jgi:hypothetical protein
VLTITTEQEAANGTITTGSSIATIAIQKLSATGLYAGQATTLTNGSNWNPSTTGSIQWATDTTIDSSFYTHSTSTNNHQITFDQTGDYFIIYNNALTASAGRPNPRIETLINSSVISGATTQSHYIRGSSSHRNASGGMATLLSGIQANDILTLTTQREADTDTVNDTTQALVTLIEKNTCPIIPGTGPTATPTNTPTHTPTPAPTDTPAPTPTNTPTPAPCPTQADCLNIDTSGATIAGGGDRELRGLTINKTDPQAITVTEITVSWGVSRNITRVRIQGSNLWNGSESSGTQLNITDYTVDTSTQNIEHFRFSGDMSGDSFTITFHMADTSTKVVVVSNPPDG